jgi:ABC-type molybdenum transport system ATPase subunit/photorepair protein PhrA
VDEPFAGLEPALARRLAGNLAQWAQAAPRALVMLAHKQTDLPFEGLARQPIRIG